MKPKEAVLYTLHSIFVVLYRHWEATCSVAPENPKAVKEKKLFTAGALLILIF